jgi:hypothetical protein
MTALIPLIFIMSIYPIIINNCAQSTAWPVSLITMVLIGTSMGILGSTLMSLVGVLPSYLMRFLLFGCALGFVVVCGVRIVCLILFNSLDESAYTNSTILYFSINTIVLVKMAITIPFFLKS